MTPSDPDHYRTGSFHGRRKGKPLRQMQSARMNDLLPRLRLDLDVPSSTNLAELFPVPVREVQLEIGFGGGEHLLAEAIRRPDIGFIGVEPFVNGMAKAVTVVADRNIQNIRFFDDDAIKLLDWLPAASLSRIDLLYPDPWPKKRNWKRRFVSDANVARFARVLNTGAHWRFASDIDTYVDWTLQHVQRSSDFNWQAENCNDWREPWPHWTRTRYETKAVREGRRSCYCTFLRV
jgi:tRNA (guanine-N7-)-methyltransferase